MSIAIYRWNSFNDEYMKAGSQGPETASFPDVLESAVPFLKGLEAGTVLSCPDVSTSDRSFAPLSFRQGHVVVSRIDMLNLREGLFLYHSPEAASFDPGERQMMETISAVLAPAIESARGREEEASRHRLEQTKRYSL